MKRGYLYSIETIIGTILMTIFILSILSLSTEETFSESRASYVASDILKQLNKEGKLQTYIQNKNYDALGRAIEELLPKNTKIYLELDNKKIYGTKKQTTSTTSTYYIPILNGKYELHKLTLEVYL